MIIKNITTTKKGNQLIHSAEVCFHNQSSERLFFSIDKKWKNALSTDATPFLAIVLIPCMQRNENINIQGASVSEEFLHNTKKIMKLLSKWESSFSPITITTQVKKDKKKKSQRASFFSGGVDSFYTYLKAKKLPQTKISTLLFVHGFDIELENTSFFNSVKKGLEKIAMEESIELLTLKTNAKRITDKYVSWDWAHGGALAGVGLLLRSMLTTVTIPGALRKDQLFPYGTHPLLDPLWGTENIEFIHDGTEYDRLDKVLSLVGNSPLALSHLRVCNQNLKGKYNCSSCFKCLWTMMTLECAESLTTSKTFEQKLDSSRIKKMKYNYALNYHLAGKRILTHLKKAKRRTDIQNAIQISLEQSKHQPVLQQMMQAIATFDKKYNNRRLFKTIFAMNKNQDRKLLFKVLAKHGFIK